MAKHQLDLDSMTAQELTALIEAAQAKCVEKQKEAKVALLEEMTAKAAQLGLSLEALIGKPAAPQTNVRKVRADAGKTIEAKFRSPKGETWSGRGRMPRWLTDAITKGKRKEDFAV